MKRQTHVATTILAVVLLTLLTTIAHAHPFGVSSVNRYVGLEAGTNRSLHIAFVVDFAELPSVDELARLDPDRDGAVTPAERDRYLDAFLATTTAQWTLQLNGTSVRPRVLHRAIEVGQGQGGLNTVRVLAELTAEVAEVRGNELTVFLRETTHAQRQGFREIRAEDSAEGQVTRSDPRDQAASDAVFRDPETGAVRRIRRIDEGTFVFRFRSPTPAVTAAPTPIEAPRPAGWRALAAGVAALAFVLFVATLPGEKAPWQRLDPRVRVLVSLLAIGFVSSNTSSAPLEWCVQACVVCTAIVFARPSFVWLTRRLLLVLLWSGALAGIRRLSGDNSTAFFLGLRVALAMLCVLPLAATTSALVFSETLARFGMPRFLVESTAATARGFEVLQKEVERLARARELRAPDASLSERIQLFGTLGAALLERGLRRSERAWIAMELRGFEGSSVGTAKPTVTRPLQQLFVLVSLLAALLLART